MIRTCIVALIAVTTAVALPAAENDPAKTSAETVEETPQPKEKVRCKTEKVTGTRSKVRRICMTQAQWDDLAARTRKGLDEMGRNASGSGTCRYEDPDRASPCF